MFLRNSGNLLINQLQTHRYLLGSLYLIFHLKFRMQVHLFFTFISLRFTIVIIYLYKLLR
ncbi:PIN family toxin-antitoxin system [Fusobacterium polymorphum]|uniref:PIN family toxin-antitoxin system n=1 Tax=Fusobacterium nucleatum subsp. polymorphum TaxID=76857 RepID=A0A2C6C9V0_FUSNP|nr:PIN family toxin-antitoxin system [Fusobacterium polymorphum]